MIEERQRQLVVYLAMLAAVVAGQVFGQIQIMPAVKEQALRASVPPITDADMARKIVEATLYTETEMPRAHQFQELSGGQGNPFTVFYSDYTRVNNIDRFTTNNREFPWLNPGGLDATTSERGEFRFIYLPRKPDGRVWPVVVYRDQLDKSDSVNMPIPTGWKWVFPYGTVLGEVLTMKFSDGYQYTYEMRLRIREIDDWEIEVYRPFPTLQSLYDGIRKVRPDLLKKFNDVQMVNRTLEDRQHNMRRGFSSSAAELALPALPPDVVKYLLTRTTFQPCMGKKFATSEGNVTLAAFAPTTKHAEQIVPTNYQATFIGSDRDSCKQCHQDTMRHTDRFQNRDWYGWTRGSDGIFSFLPIEPSSIGQGRPVRLRSDMQRAGMVEMYDAKQHPANMYSTSRYDVTPAKSYPRTGQVTIGG